MRRRRFIAATALPLLGGCLAKSEAEVTPNGGRATGTEQSDANDGRSETRTARTETATDRPGSGRSARQSVSAIDEFSDSVETFEPFEAATVGDGVDDDSNRPHEVVVWNDGPRRTLDVVVQGGESGPTYDRQIEFPENGFVSLELTERVEYTVGVAVTGDRLSTFDLDAMVVDCNSSRTTVRVDSDGVVAHAMSSTLLACDI